MTLNDPQPSVLYTLFSEGKCIYFMYRRKHIDIQTYVCMYSSSGAKLSVFFSRLLFHLKSRGRGVSNLLLGIDSIVDLSMVASSILLFFMFSPPFVSFHFLCLALPCFALLRLALFCFSFLASFRSHRSILVFSTIPLSRLSFSPIYSPLCMYVYLVVTAAVSVSDHLMSRYPLIKSRSADMETSTIP